MTARKDNDIKKLSGTFRKHREVSADFLEPLAELPEPPVDLPYGAQDVWRELAPAVCAAGISTADLAAFKLLATTLWTATEARQEIERDGYVLASGKTGHRSHPCVSVMQAARVQAAALLAQFGLTPKSRIGTTPPPKAITRTTFDVASLAAVPPELDHSTPEFWAQFKLPGDAS